MDSSLKTNSHETSQPTFVFFGSAEVSIAVLDELEKAGYVPSAVVTMPDKPKGRSQIPSPSEVKAWAQERNIPALTPESLKGQSSKDHEDDVYFEKNLRAFNADFFVVASYGKIIPPAILNMPPHKILNVHPSLLPRYRGPSPIQSMILADEEHTGVTIMELDEQMDHGPIVAQKEIKPNTWPMYEGEAKDFFGREGGRLLASILPKWLSGEISPSAQDHDLATYTKKIKKEDGLIEMESGDHSEVAERQKYLKVLAYHEWPKAYMIDSYNGRSIRVIISRAVFDDQNQRMEIVSVIPEGKKEMSYKDYLRGKRSN